MKKRKETTSEMNEKHNEKIRKEKIKIEKETKCWFLKEQDKQVSDKHHFKKERWK